MPAKKRKAAKKRKVAKKRVTKKKAIKRRPVKRPAKKKVIRRKPAARKKVKKTAPKKPAVKKPGKEVGLITHYFPKVMAAVVKLKIPLAVGDMIKVKGHTTDFTEEVTSMQIDHVPVTSAKKGDEIGLMVKSRVRRHDVVYKI